jgi:hypothetical protein
MTDLDRRRHRNLADGITGGLLTFLFELGIVVGLGVVAHLLALLVLL